MSSLSDKLETIFKQFFSEEKSFSRVSFKEKLYSCYQEDLLNKLKSAKDNSNQTCFADKLKNILADN